MKRVIIALLTSVALLPVHADKVWTLQECISYAVAHNLIIKQQEANVKQQEISLSTSRNSRLPNLSGSVGESFNFGRALTANNTYANRNTQSTNFSLSTNVPLFTGGQIPAETEFAGSFAGLRENARECDAERGVCLFGGDLPKGFG